MAITSVIGRVCLGLIFVMGAANRLPILGGVAAGIAPLFASVGIKNQQIIFAMHAIATVMELIGGLMVILNFPSTKLGAQTLIAFIVPMTVIMHLMPALTLADPEKKQNELIATLKNISILGGLLILYSKEASKAKKN